MKRIVAVLCALIGCALMSAAQSAWQYGRIGSVQKSVNTKTKAWVVNTPITEDEITYTISVHVQDKVITGTYQWTPEESAPPEEWTTNFPVKIQFNGDRLHIRSLTGDLSLHIVRQKNAKLMMPLTVDERKRLDQMDASPGSLVGFSQQESTSSSPTTRQPETALPQAPTPAPLPVTTGMVNVRSTPYLSEVFVDGESMGYTPAKLSLAPGKHSFRVEKPGYKGWTKEITLTVGSELTLEASLDKK